MKVSALSLFFAALLMGLPLVSFAGPTDDSDADTISDVFDNCINVANSSTVGPNNQNDSDGDLCGDVCDGDYNQDGVVGVPDFFLWSPCFGLPDTTPGCGLGQDATGDGVIGVPDFFLWSPQFGGGPGPSGTSPGTLACPNA